MSKKPNKKTFHLNTIVNGHLVSGTVAFSPAPPPGIFTELARFEAERILQQMIQQDLDQNRP